MKVPWTELRQRHERERFQTLDFDEMRDRFYDMVRRHLSYIDDLTVAKGKKKDAPKPAKVPGRDGNQERREKYGEHGIHSYWNIGAGTVEMFERQSRLLDSKIEAPYTDQKRDQAAFEGNQRRRVARNLRELFEGADISPLRSADLDTVFSGFGPRSPSDHALDCQKVIHQMRGDIPPGCMRMIESVIVRDEFLWENDDRKKEERILQDIRMALDFASWSLGSEVRGKREVSRNDLCERWAAAREFFYQSQLRPAISAARVIRKGK